MKSSPSTRLFQKDNGIPAPLGAFVAISAVTLRVAKAQLFTKSRTIPVAIIPVIDFRWTRLRVSLQRVIAKTRQTVVIKTHVHGCVRSKATDSAYVEPYLMLDGDLEKRSRLVRKR